MHSLFSIISLSNDSLWCIINQNLIKIVELVTQIYATNHIDPFDGSIRRLMHKSIKQHLNPYDVIQLIYASINTKIGYIDLCDESSHFDQILGGFCI